MRRNNEERALKGHRPNHTEDANVLPNPMDFIRPTQLVELPSKGLYPPDHPLCGSDTVEINYMTAKDEDILTNRSLLRKGLAIDKLIQNLITDESIDARSLYIGDRNAIMIYARAAAYGEEYKTKIQCPACSKTSKFSFNLTSHEIYSPDTDVEEITNNHDGSFTVVLPASNVHARIRPMTGVHELEIMKSESDNGSETLITDQIRYSVVDFNGYNDDKTLTFVINNMVAKDSRYLRKWIDHISPDITMKTQFDCPKCHSSQEVTVPFGTEFFWPES